MKSGVPLERHRAASGRMHTESMRTHEYMHALKKKRQAASREGRKKLGGKPLGPMMAASRLDP